MPLGPSQDKFECRYCGCKQSTVRSTTIIERKWKNNIITMIKRHRVCRHCFLSYVTVEHQYEDIVSHEIPHDSAQRPLYDYGRGIGAMEFINAINKPSEEQDPPPAPTPPNPARPRRRLIESSPTEKPPKPKSRRR